jgi:apolipoprotein N-acyltransferase
MSALRAIALGTAGGLAIALAAEPTGASSCAFFGPALLLFAIDDTRSTPASPHVAGLAGLACGFTVNAWAMRWAIELFEVYASLPPIAAMPLAVLLWLAQSLPFALAAWAASPLLGRGMAGWVVLPGAITVAGSVSPMIFPWRLGASQVPGLVLAQCADLGGPPLVDLAVALGSCGIAEALRRRDRRAAIAGTLAIALPFAYGVWRLQAVRAERNAAPIVRVGVVQGNVGIVERLSRRFDEEHLAHYREATRALETRGADVVLWPESAYPYPIDRRAPREATAVAHHVLRDGVRGPVLFGALSHDGVQRFNSVLALGPDGRFAGIYDKVHLLAFGEYVPLWDLLPPLQSRFSRGFTPGPGPRPIDLSGIRIGILHCYEDLWAEHTRRTAALTPSFLANFTNDAWFGDTAAPHLHHMLARMRAIETRRDLVRAVNTGVSAHVLATGEDRHRTRPFTRTSFVAEVRSLSGTTPWVHLGDWLTPGLLGAWLGALAAAHRRHGSSRPYASSVRGLGRAARHIAEAHPLGLHSFPRCPTNQSSRSRKSTLKVVSDP